MEELIMISKTDGIHISQKKEMKNLQILISRMKLNQLQLILILV
jgi:hypothetical protein